MESFLKLYFGNALARNRVIMTIIYLLAMVLVVNGVLGWFGIHYSFPKEITLATVFNFIFSAQILYPLAGIILYYSAGELFAYFIAVPLYHKCKFYIFRRMSDEGMISTVESELMQKKFITWSFLPQFKKGPLQQGNAFHQFEPWLKAMFWEEFNVVQSWKLSAHAMFAVMLALAFHLNSNPILVVAFILSFLGWLFFTLVYWQFARQSEYRELYEQMYFNVANPLQAKEIYQVSTWNKYTKGFQAWEKKKKVKKRWKRWVDIRKKKLI